MNRRIASIATAALLAVGMLAGCSDDADELIPRGETVTDDPEEPGGRGPDDDDSAEEPAETQTEGADAKYPETADLREVDLPISAQEAIDTAAEEAGAGYLYSIEVDYSRSHSTWVYEVKILDGTTKHEYEISAVSGDVVDSETESTDDQEQEITLGEPMEFVDALEAATKEVDEPLRGWKYEYDDGALMYQFDLGPPRDPVEITVNAETGQVGRD